MIFILSVVSLHNSSLLFPLSFLLLVPFVPFVPLLSLLLVNRISFPSNPYLSFLYFFSFLSYSLLPHNSHNFFSPTTLCEMTSGEFF